MTNQAAVKRQSARSRIRSGRIACEQTLFPYRVRPGSPLRGSARRCLGQSSHAVAPRCVAPVTLSRIGTLPQRRWPVPPLGGMRVRASRYSEEWNSRAAHFEVFETDMAAQHTRVGRSWCGQRPTLGVQLSRTADSR